MTTWWLSFCNAKLPKGTQFLGVVLVDAVDLHDAVTQTHLAGCNPGGEIECRPIPPLEAVPDDFREDAERTYALPRLTLLSRADLVSAGCKPRSAADVRAGGHTS